MSFEPISNEYLQVLHQIKQHIQQAQMRAMQQAQREVARVYWYIGKIVTERQQSTKWGNQFLKQLSIDLQREFQGARGYSVPNLQRMRQFYQAYPSENELPPPIMGLPWAHIQTLMFQVKDKSQQEWYALKTLESGWSRSVLEMQIEQELYSRQSHEAQKVSNFHQKLPPPDSDLAHEWLKEPFDLRFLLLTQNAKERQIEGGMVGDVTKLLLEMGTGFAFVGNQVPLTVGEKEFALDLLFYNYKLHCFFVVEIKARDFKPSDVGQINFYLTAVDKQIKGEQDKPSIGLLLCKSRDKVVAEYALDGATKPIGISSFKLLPPDLKNNLPSIEEIEKRLSIEHVVDEDDGSCQE